jgi:hypothetical protein
MEANMTAILRLGIALALVLPFTAAARADDAAYCKALVGKYETYIVKTAGRNPNPGTADGNVAADQCARGDAAGIPVLERKLRDARIELPQRG